MRRGTRSGVALIEMLVALAVMAAIAATLAALYGFLARATSAIEAHSGTGALIADRLALRRWIEEAPLAARLEGGPEGVRLTSLLEAPFDRARPVEIVIGVGPSGRLQATAAQPESAPEQILILSGTGALAEIAYFGRLAGQTEPSWHATWPEAAGLPDLIRIRHSDLARTYPPLTVQPAREARYSEMSLSSPVPPG